MIKDCIFYTYKDRIPGELKTYIKETVTIVAGITSGISCNYLNGRYVNITVINDMNKQEFNESITLLSVISRIKPINFN